MSFDGRDFLTSLGIEITSVSGHNLIFRCPWHGYDRHPSARLHIRDGVWLCSTCGEKGNRYEFLARLRGLSLKEASYFIDQRYELGRHVAVDEFSAQVRRNLMLDVEPIRERVKPSEFWVPYFMASWEESYEGLRALHYMQGERGFTPQALEHWQIGFDAISNRIVIPIRDMDGTLVGFKARALPDGPEPRYLILGGDRYGFQSYSKSSYVYGLNRILRGGRVVILEGELNVVATWQKTKHLAVGVAGAEFSNTQRDLIASRCSEATVYFDDDVAGLRGAQKVASMLMPYMPVRLALGAPGDAAELDGEQIDEVIATAEPALLLHCRGDIVLAT